MGTWIYYEAKKMNCVIYKEGKTHPGLTSITLEREGMILIVKGVPADCSNCGESYIRSDVTREILKLANTAHQAGVHLEICSFKVA